MESRESGVGGRSPEAGRALWSAAGSNRETPLSDGERAGCGTGPDAVTPVAKGIWATNFQGEERRLWNLPDAEQLPGAGDLKCGGNFVRLGGEWLPRRLPDTVTR